MTSSDPAAPTAAEPIAPTDRRAPSALLARHWFLVAAPVLAGLLCVLGAAADPAADLDGAELVTRYAADPESLQWKSLGYHFGYALWGSAAVLLALLVRGRRGGWAADGALLLGLLGATSLPGFLIVDFYDSAIGQSFGLDGDAAVQELIGGMWALGVISTTAVAGFLLCLPVAVLAAWRARLLPWWAAVAPVAGLGLGFMVIGANVLGASVMTVGFAGLSVGLARTGPGVWTASPDRAASGGEAAAGAPVAAAPR